MTEESMKIEENSEITATQEQAANDKEQTVKEKTHSGFSVWLNRYFHHIDRGGSLSGEVGAGIAMMILSVCSVFLTMQIIANAQGGASLGINESADFYVTAYLAAMLVSFVGTLVVGFIARLPFVQTSSLSLTTMMVSMIGASNGLTYYNVIFISFLSSVIYALIVSIPMVRKYVFEALPKSIRKILPAVSGAIIIMLALQTLGLVKVGNVVVSVPGNAPTEYAWGGIFSIPQISTDYTGASYGAMYAGLIAGILAIVCYVVMKSLKTKHPVGWTLLFATILYFGIAAIIDVNIITGWARLWLIGSEDTLQMHLGNGFGNLFSSIGKIFSAEGGGMDFSGYQGNVVSLVVGGLICFLMLSMYDGQSTLEATAEKLGFDADDTKNTWIAQTCNAGMGVVSALVGTTPVSLGKESVAGADDNAKSGIASIVASIGFLVSMFVWIIPTVMATYVNLNIAFANGEYGHLDMGSLQMTLYCTFGVADAVMIAMGVKMMKCLGNIDRSDVLEWVPAVVAIVAAVAFTNLAYGVAFGVLAYTLMKLLSFRKEDQKLGDAFKQNFVGNLKTFPVPTAVLAVLSLIMIFML